MQKIKGISCDSRKIKDGYVFVAIQGINDDGNNYIEEAIKNGAALVISDRHLKIDNKKNVPILIVDDARRYLAKLSADFYDNPSNKLKIIGVTGTNGKTTTSNLIYKLLNFKSKKSGIIGTVDVDLGEKMKKGKLTTPAPEELQKYFHEMNKNNLQYCSMEVSSHGIKFKRIEGTKFSLKIATNISFDHLDLHKNEKNYIQVKKSFLSEESNIPVLINKENKTLYSLNKIAKNQINYSINKNTVVKAEDIKYMNKKTSFEYSLKKTISGPENKIHAVNFNITTHLVGRHNIYNSLAAITTALYYGLTPNTIKEFFKNYKGLWRRLEIVYNKDFTIIDDCAHNPGSYKAVFSTIKNMKYKNLYIINAIRGNRGIEINRENANAIATELKNIKNAHLIITECKDTAKKDDIVKTDEKNIFLNTLDKYNQQYFYYEKVIEAIVHTLEKVEKDDNILLLGAHAMDNAAKLTLNHLKENKLYI